MDNLTIITPVGIASYPHLNQPDFYKNNEHYKCKLILDASKPDVEVFRSKLEGFLRKAQDEALAEAEEYLSAQNADAKSPKAKEAYENALAVRDQIRDNFKTPLTEEWGDDDALTGNLVLNTKSQASFKKKDGEVVSLAPKFYDATPKIMVNKPTLSGGEKIALEIILVKYHASVASIGGGVAARIRSVQVIDLSSGGSMGSTGFGAVAGGFDSEGYVAPETPEVDQHASDEPSSSVY